MINGKEKRIKDIVCDDVFSSIGEILKDCLTKILPSDAPISEIISKAAISIVPDKIKSEFDIATNAAMICAKHANGVKPAEIARKICDYISQNDYVAHCDVANPAFVNIKIKDDEVLKSAAMFSQPENDVGLVRFKTGSGEKVNVEFVSVNPTGPVHIGHARSAVYGDILSLMLEKAGFDVCREFYINDAGSQINTLMKSTFIRYIQTVNQNNAPDGVGAGEQFDSSEVPEGCYPGEYLIDVAKNLHKKYGASLLPAASKNDNVSVAETCGAMLLDEETVKKCKPIIINEMMAEIKSTLKRMNVSYDVFSSEQSIVDSGDLDAAMEILHSKNLIYSGEIDAPKRETFDGEGPSEESGTDAPRGSQTLFRSSQFGDDMDRPIKKSDGSWAYFAPDIGYHYNKFKRGFNKMILVLGADHKGYSKRIKAAVNAISNGAASIDVQLCELVKFMKGDEELKMSKRKGNFLTTDDVLEEVELNVLRFMMLTKKNDTNIKFDLEKAKEHSKDNPVFYVQYAHSRCCSLERKAAEKMNISADDIADFARKLSFGEVSSSNICSNEKLRTLILKINAYPQTFGEAVRKLEPHLLFFYLHELSANFHSLWANDAEHIKFINESNEEQTKAMLTIALATKRVIASILGIFGVDPVSQM